MDLTKDQRDDLVARIRACHDALYPEKFGKGSPSERIRGRAREAYYRALSQYGDRLPRVPFARCPHTGALLTRSIDPFGLDGHWWHRDSVLEIREPKEPPTFRVLLGSLDLHGRDPTESIEEVTPGPQVPFVVPRLLRLPGMVAVITRLDLATGDSAYATTYWSRHDIPPVRLHQPWLRADLWFKNGKGGTSWTIANDQWDFALEPYVRTDQVLWIEPGDPDHRLVRASEGATFPFAHVAGDRMAQTLGMGTRSLDDPPDGTPINPFAD